MVALDFQRRLLLHGEVKSTVYQDVCDFHAKTNWIRHEHVGHNLTNVKPIEDDIYPRRRDLQLSTTELRANRISSSKVGPRRHKSVRQFDENEKIQFEDIGRFLNSAFGTEETHNGRPYPSAGGMYSVHAILALTSDAVIGVENSDTVFQFRSGSGSLDPLSNRSRQDLLEIFISPEQQSTMPPQFAIENPAFSIAYFVHLDGAIAKYQYRGYRFALLEAGAMLQQADLTASEIGWRSCVYGGFGDAELGVACGLNPAVMLPIVCQVFGRPLVEDEHAS